MIHRPQKNSGSPGWFPRLTLALLLAAAAPMYAGDSTADLDAQEAELTALYNAYEEGLDALEAGDHDTALREFRSAAEQGLEVSQYNLGIMYYSGNGVEQDFREAYRWTRQAAEQGHRAAQFNLGVLYFNSQGVNPPWLSFWPLSIISRSGNMATAAHWYEQAANQGHTEAQYNLATLFENGWGVERDRVRAHFWAQAAQENEFPAAISLLAELERKMNREEVSEARRLFAETAVEQ